MRDLIVAALAMRAKAYAPYSGYRVGAAVLGADGVTYLGCNVENVSYPATVCAERVALGAMVAAGCTTWTALAVATRDGGVPCGVCLQVMAEFAGDRDPEVLCTSESSEVRSLTLRQLLPMAFASEGVRREPSAGL